MRCFIDVDQMEVIEGLGVAQPVTEIRVSRKETRVIDFGFCRSAGAEEQTTLDLGATTTPDVRVVAKNTTGGQRYDEAATLSASGFSRVTEDELYLYRGALLVDTPLLDKLLGVDPTPQPEIVYVDAIADVSGSLLGKYFDLYDGSGAARVWVKIGGAGSAPSTPSGGRILGFIDVASGASAATVASALQVLIDADAQFLASVATARVTVTMASNVRVSNANAGNSGFTVTIAQAGGAGLNATDEDQVSFNCQVNFLLNGERQRTAKFTLLVENNLDRPTDPSPPSITVEAGAIWAFLTAIVDLTGGGATKLDGLITADGSIPINAIRSFVRTGIGYVHYQLVAGTDAEASPGIIRPDDYHASTNAKVWKSV